MKHFKIFLRALVVGLVIGGMLLLWQEFGGTFTWYVAGIAGILSPILVMFARE
tara:strand:+ start:1586 stop:1744 length:159 start_codon:yes stop_codon:yes gene_type:complete